MKSSLKPFVSWFSWRSVVHADLVPPLLPTSTVSHKQATRLS